MEGFKFRRHKIRHFYLYFLPTTLLKVIVPAGLKQEQYSCADSSVAAIHSPILCLKAP